MNRLFTAWVENVYHRRVHSETGMAPLARWMAGAPFPVPSPGDLADAFRWGEYRTVAKTGLVSLHGNRYQVDPSLAGRKVELVFDPFDLSVPAGPQRGEGRRDRPAVPDQPPLPPQGQARGPGRAARPHDGHRLPRAGRRPPHRRAGRQGQLLRPRRARRSRDPARRPGPGEVSALIAWIRRLSDAGISHADPAELAAFQNAKKT